MTGKMANRIRLSNSTFSEQAWNKINIALEANKTLQIFNLPKGRFTDAVVEDLCKFLTTNKTLIEFQFGRSRFTDEGLSSMLQALCENKTLEYFSLWESELDDTVVNDVCELLKGNATLKALQFYKSRFTNEGTTQILHAFLNNTTLTCFSMFKSALSDAVVSTICKLIEENTSLSYLQLYESTFSDDGIDQVFRALTKNTTMTQFSIQQSALSDVVVPDLCKFILENTTIQSLQFHKSKFSDDGMKKLLRAFICNTSITNFSILDSVLSDDIVLDVCNLLEMNTALRALQLYRSRFTNKGMSAILQSLTSNESLETFCLWDSELSDAAVPAFCHLFKHNKTLANLQIHRSQFTDDAIKELFLTFQLHEALTNFILWDSILTDGVVRNVCMMLKQNQQLEEFKLAAWMLSNEDLSSVLKACQRNTSLQSVNITEDLHRGSIRPLVSLIEARTSLRIIKAFSAEKLRGVMISQSDCKEPTEYLFKGCNEEMKLLLPSQYLHEILKDWLLRELVPSAFDINDNKLVLFMTTEGEHELKQSLDQRLMSVNSYFYTTYRIQTHKLAFEVQGQCQDGECTVGSQIVFGGRNNDTLLGTIGAFLTDDSDNFYMLSSCHGFRIQHAYINEPNEEGVNQRVDIGSCVADINQKDPLLDACLIQIKDKDLIAKCIPLIPGSSPQKAGLIGPYRGPNEGLAQMKTPEHAAGSIRCTDVMKYGAKTKLTHGKLVYYNFSLPSAKISGALVTRTNEENSPFTASGDSGAVIFRRQEDHIQHDVSLHEALSVHCDVVKHLDDEKEVSLSFRLDVIMTYFENVLGKKLELLDIQ